MDSVRNPITIKTEKKVNKEAVKEFAFDALYTFVNLLGFLVYILAYAADTIVKFFTTEKAAYFLAKYKKVMLGIAGLFSFFIFIGVAGGFEAGLISAAVAVPVCIGAAIVVKLVSHD